MGAECDFRVGARLPYHGAAQGIALLVAEAGIAIGQVVPDTVAAIVPAGEADGSGFADRERDTAFTLDQIVTAVGDEAVAFIVAADLRQFGEVVDGGRRRL